MVVRGGGAVSYERGTPVAPPGACSKGMILAACVAKAFLYFRVAFGLAPKASVPEPWTMRQESWQPPCTLLPHPESLISDSHTLIPHPFSLVPSPETVTRTPLTVNPNTKNPTRKPKTPAP